MQNCSFDKLDVLLGPARQPEEYAELQAELEWLCPVNKEGTEYRSAGQVWPATPGKRYGTAIGQGRHPGGPFGDA